MSESAYQKYICDACGYIYDEAEGDPDSGLAPGTRFSDIPEDWQCPLCGLSKSDLRLIPDRPVQSRTAVARPVKKSGANCRGGEDYVVIVGAGVAGWSVAEALRDKDADIPILLVTGCQGLVYPKPALSTAIAQGKSAEDLVQQDAASKADELNIDVRTDTRVIKLDPVKKRITTSKGGINFGKLILALGGKQRELPVEGDAVAQILKINDLGSYRKLRTKLDSGAKHITILGAGLIGTELAEDLSCGGFDVTVVDPGDLPLARMLPSPVATKLKECLAGKSIDYQFQATLSALDESGERLKATLSNGESLDTDLVISAAGLIPNIDLASKSKLDTGAGIAVDEYLQTSQADIFAIGDCAEVNGQVFAYIEPIRRQAKAIASVIAGTPEPFDVISPLIRVKTPSYPLSIRLPLKPSGDSVWVENQSADAHHQWDLVVDGVSVGFAQVG